MAFKKGTIPWNVGLKYKNPKISKALKGHTPWNKNKKMSEEQKIKLRKPHKITEKGKRGLIKARKLKSGKKHWNYKGGRPKCIDCGKQLWDYKVKRCRGCRVRYVVGKNHWNWKGGISFEPYSLDWTETLRRSIRERDHYTCQLCGKPQEDRVHCVHHIDYNKNNCNPDNLITLCLCCNAKVNTNRKDWEKYFKELTKKQHEK